ncbi:MAG: glucokinase [Cocleimonas sp.]|nr:glucokinase [Cocleimonas sp.]
MNFLAADIGGTKSWLCLVQENDEGESKILSEQIYSSSHFSNATRLLEAFLEDIDISLTINKACLALPGVIKGKQATLTNLNWSLDADDLKNKFSIDQLHFINDFEAAALGVGTLVSSDCITLNDAETDVQATKVVTGAGTGLGLAWLTVAHQRHYAHASEGGHIDFAPTSTQQIALLAFLLKNYSHVSYERLLSGEGLQNIYCFLNQSIVGIPQPEQISKMAQKGDPLAKKSLMLFIEIYAAYIGNLALLFKPAGGIYIAGGIAARIVPWMESKAFQEAYFHKGRMKKIAKNTAVYLIRNHRLGLQGALSAAKNL